MAISNEAIKAVYPRQGSLWTDHDNAVLLVMFEQNKSVKKISDRLERTETAVLNRLLNRNLVYVLDRVPHEGVAFYRTKCVGDVYAIYPNPEKMYRQRVALLKRRRIVATMVASAVRPFYKLWRKYNARK